MAYKQKWGVNRNSQDSIAATKAWDNFKSGYMNIKSKTKVERQDDGSYKKVEVPVSAEDNLKEYNREKHEFYYDTEKKKMRLIPTDDAERQDQEFKSKLKKWQLPPLDRKSSGGTKADSTFIKKHHKTFTGGFHAGASAEIKDLEDSGVKPWKGWKQNVIQKHKRNQAKALNLAKEKEIDVSSWKYKLDKK